MRKSYWIQAHGMFFSWKERTERPSRTLVGGCLCYALDMIALFSFATETKHDVLIPYFFSCSSVGSAKPLGAFVDELSDACGRLTV
jgi:hypothetical protein